MPPPYLPTFLSDFAARMSKSVFISVLGGSFWGSCMSGLSTLDYEYSTLETYLVKAQNIFKDFQLYNKINTTDSVSKFSADVFLAENEREEEIARRHLPNCQAKDIPFKVELSHFLFFQDKVLQLLGSLGKGPVNATAADQLMK